MADPKKPETGMASRTAKIKLKATDAHPYRKEGEIFECHPSQEKTLKERQWAVDENSKTTKVENPAVPKTSAPKAAGTEAAAPATEAPDPNKKA